MERRQVINWGIVVAAAIVLTVLQVVAGQVVWILALVIRVAILAGLAWFAYTLWRNHRSRLQWLSRRQKVLFYGAGALIVVVVAVSFLLPLTLFTSIFLLAVAGACGFVMWRMFQESSGWY
ncbi:MAG: hypothetical protein NTX95_03100 [Actinobacteria bacterium]|nr:hypothetical protein [Actinomycetota bacterium]